MGPVLSGDHPSRTGVITGHLQIIVRMGGRMDTEQQGQGSTPASGSNGKDGHGDLKEAVSYAANETREAVESELDVQRLRTAETARRAADAARDAAQNLRANEAWMASLVEKGADGLSTLAETLRQNDLKHLLSRAEDFARKQPVLFAGAAVALGFTLSRAARAGTQDTQERGALKQETSGPSYTDVEEVEIEH
jgi:ElaB/YqjD/DUF883 family membrane-anchored ribosome-binding protein